MVAGEKMWSSKGRETKKAGFEPAPAGTYRGKILGSYAEIAKKNEPGSVPYVKARIEFKYEDQKKMLFPMFFLSTKPGKNGIASPEYANGILGLARGLGQEVNFPLRAHQTGDGENIEILNPQKVVDFLKANDGSEITFELKVRKQKDRDPQNEIVMFVPAEDSSDIDGDDTDNLEEEVDASSNDLMEEDADFEPVPAKGKKGKK